MKRTRFSPTKETIYIWTGNGIARIEQISIAPFLPDVKETASKAPGAERRRYPRLDLKLPIMYRILGNDAGRIPSEVRPYLLAETSNVSPLGLCLDLAEQLSPGTLLDLSIHVIDERKHFSAMGRVVWSRPDGAGRFLTGIQLVVVEDNRVREDSQNVLADVIQRFYTKK